MRTYHLAAAVAALILYLPSALAHHSRDVYFNMDAVIELTNVTAVSFKVVNPHSQLIFVSEDDQGNEVEWTAGVMSASHLRRAGVTPDLIRPGDMLTVTGAPSLDDSNVMWLYTVVLPNGDVADLFDAIRTGTDVISPAGAR